MKTLSLLALTAMLSACVAKVDNPALPSAIAQPTALPANAFFDNLLTLCGKAYAGKLVAFNDSDLAGFGGAAVMHVRDCSASEVRIPFHVGENRSRTWIVTRTADGLRLKHDHRHDDGSSDSLTMYGGDSIGTGSGSATRQEFPADAESKAMFAAGNMKVSMDNVWAIEIVPGKQFAYELRRPNRHFRVDFDVSQSVSIPPPAWGSEARR